MQLTTHSSKQHNWQTLTAEQCQEQAQSASTQHENNKTIANAGTHFA
jgi:hypothetical protein